MKPLQPRGRRRRLGVRRVLASLAASPHNRAALERVQMTLSRSRSALLIAPSGELAADLVAGGRLVEPETATELDELAPALEPDELVARFRAGPLRGVERLFVGFVDPRRRLRLLDVGVGAIGTSASVARLRQVAPRWAEKAAAFVGRTASAHVRLFGEDWDVPAGAPVLLAMELVGARLDRDALCMKDECDACACRLRLGPHDPIERRRTCRLPARDGIDVLDPSRAVVPP